MIHATVTASMALFSSVCHRRWRRRTAADSRRRRPGALRRGRHRQAGRADHRPDGGRLRDRRARQAAAASSSSPRRRRRQRAAAAPRLPARHQRQHGSGHQGRPDRRDQVPQPQRSRRRHHARRFRHRGPRRPFGSDDYPAPDRAHPHAQARRLDRVLRCARRLPATAPSTQDGQKILVVYTDGGDTRSAITAGDVADLLKASDVTVYAVGYLEHQSSSYRSARADGAAALRDDDRRPGVLPEQPEGARRRLREDLTEIGARYILGYMSTDTRTDGSWRPVEIKLKRPDLKGAKVRTRAGYFAPLPERATCYALRATSTCRRAPCHVPVHVPRRYIRVRSPQPSPGARSTGTCT